jgi:quercetin dioxygenase-like cupin family protein
MEKVFSLDDMVWKDVRGLPGARGFEFKSLTDEAYTKAYSCELVRLEPGDHSVPHVEPWNHLLYFLTGTGDVTIEGAVTAVRDGTVCQVRAGEKHSLRNLGREDMLVLTIYDPPRDRKQG